MSHQPSSSNFVDFKGRGMVESIYLPHLEKACGAHPHLLTVHISQTGIVSSNAFRVLGKLLHFLATKKFKEMEDEDLRGELRTLWTEVNDCRFDVRWLSNFVNNALNYGVEKDQDGNLLKEKRVSLDAEYQRLGKKLDSLDTYIYKARSELEILEEELEDINPTVPVGYGIK